MNHEGFMAPVLRGVSLSLEGSSSLWHWSAPTFMNWSRRTGVTRMAFARCPDVPPRLRRAIIQRAAYLLCH